MKKSNLLQAVLLLSNLIYLTACNQPSESPSESVSHSESITETQTPSSSESDLPQSETVELVFEGMEVEYDGQEKALKVEGLPEDATVTYTGNYKTEPGNYGVKAKVVFADGSRKTLSAKLIINKCTSVLTAEEVQEALSFGGATPSFSLNNTEQQIIVNPIFKPGVYELELYAKENEHYTESNHVFITFTVKKGNSLGVEFDSKNVMYNGQAQSIEAKNIPAGYHVEYENNTGTEQGTYNAVCKVYNESNELALTLNALLKIENEDYQPFNDYLNEFFADYLGNDFIAWNIFTIDSEAFGLVRDENDPYNVPQWYTYETLGENYMAEAYEEMKGFHELLLAFENERLSYSQRISFNRLNEFFQSSVDYYNPENGYDSLTTLRYIDQFGGYAADFPTYVEAYILKDKQDISDVFSYFKSLPEAFNSYLTYASDRITAGYPISDYTIDEMIGYLNSVVQDGAEYYLNEVFTNKINGCEFLTADEKSAYALQVDEYMETYFIPAHKALAEGLVNYKGHCEVEGYLSSYGEVGKKQFIYDLKDLLGLPNLNMDLYGRYLYSKISTYSSKLNSIVNEYYKLAAKNKNAYNAFGALLNGSSAVGIQDPNEMLDYLKEFAKTIVPELETTPDITVKYMDDSVASVSNAVAYYMKSALDNYSQEVITLNGKQLSSDYNETLSTMAHEGYPGHLYAYVYNKQLDIANVTKIMTSTAHAEGWATYVQLKLFEYIKEHNSFPAESQEGVALYCDYSYYNQLVGYLLYTYVDYGIHVEGWDTAKIKNVMDSLGFNGDAAGDLYKTLIEMPSGYAAYGYGMSFMLDLHVDAQKSLGALYDEIEFNKVVLSHGWCSLGELEKVVNEYVEQTLFEYNMNK